MVQHIDIPKDAHGIRHCGIAVVIDVWEVFRASLAVQPAVVDNFNTVWILVESHWRIAIVVAVHDGIHQKLPDCPFGIVADDLLAESRHRHGSLLNNRHVDEGVQLRQQRI